MFQSFWKHKTSSWQIWCAPSRGYLHSVTPHICILQVNNETRCLRDIRKLRRKLKQAENTSKSTLLICVTRKLQYTIGGYHQKISETVFSQNRKLNKGAPFVLLEVSGAAYLSSAKILENHRERYHK